MSYTTADLLSLVKKKCFIPETQDTLSDDDILEIATAELKDNLVPMIIATREGFFMADKTVQPSEFNNNATRIPHRAIGMALREVKLLNGSWEVDIARTDEQTKGRYTNSGYPSAFTIEGNKLVIIGSVSLPVKLYYLRRPSELVQTEDAMAITDISSDRKTLTVSSVLSTFAADTKIDLVKATPGFEVTDESLSIDSVTATEIVFASAVSDDVEVGDWISLEDTTPVPQIPTELFSLLAQATAVQVFDSLGDFEAKQSAEAKLMKMADAALTLLTPRVAGESKSFIAPRNRGASRWGNNWGN